jgi:hypothetical protein
LGGPAEEAKRLPLTLQRRVVSRLVVTPINSRNLRALFNERILRMPIGDYAQNIKDS